ncbi:serine palmitoyltransferase [Pancytospora epiphaga]|nr:serine palmitoyltransferase [Pancytospora epiphaga]
MITERILNWAIVDRLPTIAIQLIGSFAIYILLRYRFRDQGSKIIPLRKSTVNRLIEEYKPEPLVDEIEEEDKIKTEIKGNFATYDLFKLGELYKTEIKDTIIKYGIGTCGPRGFYGTLNIHLELERKLAEIFGKAECALYSNHFMAIQSIVACFCRTKNTVYFCQYSSEPILRGLSSSKAATIAYTDIDDLERKLDASIANKYVVVEHLGKNTGVVFDVPRLMKLRSKFGFRVILDVSYSYPFIIKKIEPAAYADIDVISGSLCCGFPANGGFSCGSTEVVEYQRLSAQSYVFSASMPGFIARALLCFLSHSLDYDKLTERLTIARENISGIVSDRRSPILLVKCKDPAKLQRKLRQAGYLCGINGDYLRIGISIDTSTENIKAISEIIKLDG